MPIPKSALEELEKRRTLARAGGGEDKLEARRKKGVMTARDRLNQLFQPGTFQEWGLHADHDCHHFGLEKKSLPGDGVVTGDLFFQAQSASLNGDETTAMAAELDDGVDCLDY